MAFMAGSFLVILPFAAFIATWGLRVLYNVLLHPLSRYPGPKLFAATQLLHTYHNLRGDLPFVVKRLHDQYGPVVRIAPAELAYISAEAWRDIYGFRQGHSQNPKDLFIYAEQDPRFPPNILVADDADHSRMRSQLSYAFSAKAIEAQQSIIGGYVDLLIEKLRHHAPEGPQNIVAWLNWTTFDIVADLTFGEPFNCLRDTRYHDWVNVIVEGLKAGTWVSQIRRYGLLPMLIRLVPASMLQKREDMLNYSVAHVNKRLDLGDKTERPDFTTFMLKETKKGDPAMTREEMQTNAEILVIAGSETTATLLAGLTFLLTRAPEKLARATKEVRDMFSEDSRDQINSTTVSQRLPYLHACIKEALRFYPPTPFGMARKIVGSGSVIDGQLVPPGTSVSVSQWASNHSASNWTKPDDFVPERWLDEASSSNEFTKDKRDALHPFSHGPRSCLGKNLAEMEMRLIMARFLWKFDLEVAPGQEHWLSDQKCFVLWEKPPLMVNLKARS